jgi:hypothetical protein
LDYTEGIEPARRRHTTALLKLCAASGLYPECIVLKGVQLLTRDPIAAGNFGDVWKGVRHGKAIAVKSPHIYRESDMVQLLKVIRLCP